MKSLTVEAKTENLNLVLGFVDERLESMGCRMKTQTQIDVAVEEIFVNIASYAYAPDTGLATITVDTSTDISTDTPTDTSAYTSAETSAEESDASGSIILTFADSGTPYDPLAKPDPNVTLSAEERSIGGLGIYMVKTMMDDVSYEYKDGKNILTLIKKIN